MSNKKLPYEISYEIEDRFKSNQPKIELDGLNVRIILKSYGETSILTFENYEFLAALFNTTKVNTRCYISPGNNCPTCDPENFEISEITFTISDIKIDLE